MSNMTAKPKPSRGRPVGSGIDDRERLLAITAVMAANPGIRPTTAIKALGFTDTSVIRRLRDKLKAAHPGVMAASAAAQTSKPVRAVNRAAASDNVRAFKISEEAPPRTTSASSAAHTRTGRSHFDPMLLAWVELMAGSFNAVLSAQQAFVGMMMQNPVFRTMLSQHISANEAAMALLRVPVSPHRNV